MTFQVVFNLYPFNETQYLPSANIVRSDESGELTYVVQRATAATMPPYSLEMTPLLRQLLDIVELLTPKALESKFKPSRARTETPLAQLLANKDTKPVVERFIFSQLDLLLSDLVRHRLPLTLHAERKTLAKDVQVAYSQEALVPHLFFKKTSEGIEYRLRLGTEQEAWSLQERNVVPLTNTDPAWLLIDYVLFRAPGINGNMVRPFRQKESVHIPPDKERVYFRQFIAKSIRRSRVEAEGFRVDKQEKLRATRLEVVEHVLEGRWMLKPVFEYEGAEFSPGDRRDRVTALDIPEDGPGEVSVQLICRDAEAEAGKLRLLSEMGLQDTGGGTFGTEEADFFTTILFLTRHLATLEAAGFSIAPPQVEGKTLALLAHEIGVRSEARGDWFDIQGEVQVGAFSFPFKKFVPYLRRNDTYFPLPDGAWFLIPGEWFARYGELAGAVQEHQDQLRLPKALFTVLQATGSESVPEAGFPDIDPDNVAFSPSEQLRATLRPYQLRGVKWLIGHYHHGFGACLADDMGLGKTLQTIAVLLHAKENMQAERPAALPSSAQLDLFGSYREELKPLNALVILPASLVFNWQQELTKFSPTLFVYAHTGAKRLRDARALSGYDVVLTTYHTARQDLDLLEKIPWHFIVLDESQQIKNRDSEVSKVVRSLQGEHKISLSGTPIENSLADLWTQMEFINPDTLGSYKSFREQFQTPIEKQGDEQARTRLFGRVKPFFMRRTKEEVAPDLPPLSRQVFYTEMPAAQLKQYERVKSAVRNEILSLFDDPKTRFAALQALTRLRQIANHPVLADPAYEGESGKTADVLAQWDVIRRSGHKALFFSSFEQHLQIFKKELDAGKQEFAWLTGGVSAPERARAVSEFQEKPSVQAFLMTLGAGGVGLNLTAADYVLLLDPWWNPAKEEQAIARAHRIGRKHPVTAIRFIARDTIEEKILQLQERKRALGRELFAQGADFPALEREDVELLLE
ncbi:MAG: DEAD/DEAH box helicase [Saprospiraceae bacterium]